MSVNRQKITKWAHMLTGQSVYHVNQGLGRVYSKTEIKGYYNDLTEKVTRFGYSDNQIPQTTVDSGETIFFSIAIFQYGLGAYDMYLLSGKKDVSMLQKAIACANWGVENQQEDGAWVTFAFENPENPYSAMAQGEGISLLLRVYQECREDQYLVAATKAKAFMLLPIEDGGTTLYKNDDVFLFECPQDPLILNGWIFSLWGLMDYLKIVDDADVRKVLDSTLRTLEEKLPDFSLKYWSKYEDGNRICSPFYHKLHIAQLNVMYELTGRNTYKFYADKWQRYYNNRVFRLFAFIRKAWQKVIE